MPKIQDWDIDEPDFQPIFSKKKEKSYDSEKEEIKREKNKKLSSKRRGKQCRRNFK